MSLAVSSRTIAVTLPDGAVKTFDTPVTARDVAESLAKSLAKDALVAAIDGELIDLDRPLEHDVRLRFIRTRDAEALEVIRHDAAHVMAEAVQDLFPGTQVTIGPPIADGFYYDFARNEPFSTDDLAAIEARMAVIIKANRPFTRQEVSREEARATFERMGEHYKVELLDAIPEGEPVSLYYQGEWFDLCRGPHGPSTGRIGAFKLLKVAGAYWRGDSNNAQLQRIYGTAYATDKELQAHLIRLEEAEKRDHRRIGKELDLFHFQEEAPGQVFWHAKGWIIYQELLAYMRRMIKARGYDEINTPQLLDSRFWQASGHWEKYQDNMFLFEAPESEHISALKPMSCPGGAQVYASTLRSYRELPLRLAEFGTVFRKEASGARHGLMRVQAFTQDDAHIFCRDQELEDEVVAMCDLITDVYTDLGIADDITVHFATRPEQRIGSEEDWDRAENALRKVLDRIDLRWVINEGDGAFYAPKLDFKLKDAIGRQWQCGTVQVDMNMPHRLDLRYVGEDGALHTPHMVHRAILGSVERFIGVLIEHYAGRLPAWLAPVQVVVATITNEVDTYAHEVAAALRDVGLRVHVDTRADKIGYKVREHSLQKVPYILALGARERDERSVALRRLGETRQESLALEAAVTLLMESAKPPA